MDTVLTQPITKIDVSHIVTEDDTPVDNWFSEKQQRLLVTILYLNWERYQPFVAGADIGVFDTPHTPPIVPDVLVSFDTEIADDWYAKENRTYFIWEFGKPPEIVVEVVSNKVGGELTRKLQKYARIRVSYYIVFDPQQLIQDTPVVVYELAGGTYRKRDDLQLNWYGLGVTLWEGSFENKHSTYLRWTDSEGNLLLNAEEMTKSLRTHVDAEKARASEEKARADEEKARADEAEAHAAKVEAEKATLLKLLHEAGIDPS